MIINIICLYSAWLSLCSKPKQPTHAVQFHTYINLNSTQQHYTYNRKYVYMVYQKSLELSTHKLIAHKVSKLWLLYTNISASFYCFQSLYFSCSHYINLCEWNLLCAVLQNQLWQIHRFKSYFAKLLIATTV